MDPRICIMVWASYQGRADLWGTWLDAPVYYIYNGKIGRGNKIFTPPQVYPTSSRDMVDFENETAAIDFCN